MERVRWTRPQPQKQNPNMHEQVTTLVYKVLIEQMPTWHSENTNVEYSVLCVKQSDAKRGVQVLLQRHQTV